MVELFFSKFSTIDVHDHYRQGSLEMESQWLTHRWQMRLFGTVFGMIIVDAFLAYRYEKSQENVFETSPIDFNDFLQRLAYQLVFNEFIMERSTRGKGEDDEYSAEVSYSSISVFCILTRVFLPLTGTKTHNKTSWRTSNV
jgi:hypothetical protein